MSDIENFLAGAKPNSSEARLAAKYKSLASEVEKDYKPRCCKNQSWQGLTGPTGADFPGWCGADRNRVGAKRMLS